VSDLCVRLIVLLVNCTSVILWRETLLEQLKFWGLKLQNYDNSGTKSTIMPHIYLVSDNFHLMVVAPG